MKRTKTSPYRPVETICVNLEKIAGRKCMNPTEVRTLMDAAEKLRNFSEQIHSKVEYRTMHEHALGGTLVRIAEMTAHALGDHFVHGDDLDLWTEVVKLARKRKGIAK